MMTYKPGKASSDAVTRHATLKGVTAVITGASSGIGAATAEALAEKGMTVALLARRKKRLDTLADKINDAGLGPAATFEVDVSDIATVKAALEDIAQDRSIAILINCAGVGTWRPAVEAELSNWDTMVDVNLRGVLNVTHAALPYLLQTAKGERGIADIVNVSSIAGRKIPSVYSNVYAATKHAVGAFSEALRQELTEHHIRVGLIEPGLVRSEMTTSGEPYAPDARSARHLSVLNPIDVADAILYMVSRPRHAAINEVLMRATEQVI